ncbi:acyltransferase [Terrihabitans sp. B22-R8]|uniref:acyltransferase n=1 Tax=Terrihabitans sp. B22-R8 TaxID=3425128 RepID=UPI00403C8F1D
MTYPGNKISIGNISAEQLTLETSGSGIEIDIAQPSSVHHLHIVAGPASSVKIGQNCVLGSLFVYASANTQVVIGANVGFNGCVRLLLHEPKAIHIGEGSLFAGGIDVTVSDMHPIFDLDTGERLNKAKDVIIGKHVWIGQHSQILKGAEIGDGSVIGAGSIVTGKIPANRMAAGSPARIIGSRRVRWEHVLRD